MSEELHEKLKTQIEKLAAEVAALKELDMDAILASSSSRRKSAEDDRPKKPKHEKPDWIQDWNRRHASNGEVKTRVRTIETYHETTGVIDAKTEIVDPIVETKYQRDLAANASNLWSGEESTMREIVTEVGLPAHLRLNELHGDRPAPVNWAERPTHDGVIRKDLPLREALAELEANPGSPLELRDEGPTQPVRKQMVRLSKVWKYRNFQKCANCESYDTWEARVDPYNLENVGVVHAEIWCHTCGATGFEVADKMPDHIGSWAPPSETQKEKAMKIKRRIYREERTLVSLAEIPKTDGELLIWFREVEDYAAIDMVMVQIMLNRMQEQGRVVRSDGKWWNGEDWQAKHPSPRRKKGKKGETK